MLDTHAFYGASGEMEELREMREQPIDPQAEQEIINSIEEVYFSSDSFDIVEHELKVSKKVADLILEKQPSYVKQRTDVRLSEMLEEEDYPGAIQLCLECQKAASTFKHYSCISELNSKLQDTLEQIEEQLDVALSKTCKSFDINHYTKVQQAYTLLGKTQTAMDQLHMHFTQAIHNTVFQVVLGYVELCAGNADTKFQKMQYKDLCTTAMDQLHMHFTQAIHNTVFQVVLGYVELCAGNADTKFQKMQYKDLCTHITPDSYIPCLSDLCKALWEVMLSYHRTMEWHEEHDNEETVPASDGSSTVCTEESNFDRSYVKKKLEHGLTRIWQDVQLKAKTYLLGTDMSNFKYDDFIFVLDVISRLMQVGEEFCGSRSEVLQESIKKQSVNYFKNYHRTRLEELRMFLENETWELCPVKSNFSIVQLHEFKFMGRSRSPSVSPSKHAATASTAAMSLFEQYHNGGNPFEMQTDSKDDETEDVLASNGEFKFMGRSRSPSVSPSKHAATASTAAMSLFEQYHNGGNPFEMQTDSKDDETEDVLASNGYESDELEKCAYQDYDSDSDVPEELKRDYVDEQTGDAPVKSVSRDTLRSRKKSDYSLNKVNAPILTNTTLNVIRLVGKYMQMMNILKPIAFDVIHCMSQLFDYYLYAVYAFFGRNDMYESSGLGLISSRLRTTLNRIQESLIDLLLTATLLQEAAPETTGSHVAAEERKEKVPSPHLSQLVVLTASGTLYGLAERVVATESFELRKPIYWIVAAKAIDYEQMLLLMAGVKWDIKEIMSQHNIYVDVLLKEFEQFNKRLGDVSRQVRIPLPVSNVLWEHCIRLANRTLVEGYANVKKCSNEGRALMQLDFQQFLMKLEKLTDIRPIPDKEFVETYIKAYYLTENDMEEFIKNHREYSIKQLTNLVNVCLGSHINKKARQKLLAAIDDIDRPKR
ncbi:Syndetin [Acipenser ruthenus]|uniref:Syndetin n=1 Tax=Acipenser ruthenus TaxID=7906 RepID=A0A444UAR8_ACIRT|nr:Syndetin [Acipenser ruthenus]